MSVMVRIINVVVLANSLAMAQITSSNESQHFNSDSPQELQWVLGVSEQNWSPNVQQLAFLLDSQRFNEADQFLDKWLIDDFYSAMQSLPVIQHFFDYFPDHSIAPIYTKHLMKLEDSQRFSLLSQLNLENYGVYKVGTDLLVQWWYKNPETLLQWFSETPDFYELEYIEHFMEKIKPTQSVENVAQWTKFFWQLDDNNLKKNRFFESFFTDLIELDFSLALSYSEEFYALSKQSGNNSIDRVAQAIAIKLAEDTDHKAALNWLSRIDNQSVKEITVRDIIFSFDQLSATQIYTNWLSQNPIQSKIVNTTIEDHLASLTNDTVSTNKTHN